MGSPRLLGKAVLARLWCNRYVAADSPIGLPGEGSLNHYRCSAKGGEFTALALDHSGESGAPYPEFDQLIAS